MSERDLWLAVLQQAVADATSPAGPEESRRNIQREALQWLKPGNADFQEVCYLADVDPDAFYEGFCRAYPDIKLFGEYSKRFHVKVSMKHKYVAFDQALTLDEWSEKSGIKVGTLASRLRQGWSIEVALTTPATIGRRPKKPITGGKGLAQEEISLHRAPQFARDPAQLEIF